MTNEQFRLIRKHLNMTQVELAEALGVQQGTISRWESGAEDIMPTAKKLLLMLIDEATIKKVLAH